MVLLLCCYSVIIINNCLYCVYYCIQVLSTRLPKIKIFINNFLLIIIIQQNWTLPSAHPFQRTSCSCLRKFKQTQRLLTRRRRRREGEAATEEKRKEALAELSYKPYSRLLQQVSLIKVAQKLRIRRVWSRQSKYCAYAAFINKMKISIEGNGYREGGTEGERWREEERNKLSCQCVAQDCPASTLPPSAPSPPPLPPDRDTINK